MGHINFSIPKDLVEKIQKKEGYDIFIETGTWRGGTCFWAANFFKKVYTIEINPEISKSTSSKPDCPKNIEFLIGDSSVVLPELLQNLEGKLFFWLDGHWCGGISGGEENPCPLLDELESIAKNNNESIIFIDDARCFLGPLPPPNDPNKWPLIDEIFFILKKHYPNSFTTIIDDVIICVPENIKPIIFDYWTETFDKRYESNLKVDKKGIKKILNSLKL